MNYHISYEHLGMALNDILSLIKPSKRDHEIRELVIVEFQSLITSLGMKGFADAEVKQYGSFLYNLYTKTADLDLSVNIPGLLLSDGEALAYIWRALMKRNYVILNFVPEARIPVVSFESKRWSITCDVTVNNHLAQIKSKFLLWISKIDNRFCDMVLLVKEWARTHDINDPKEGTLNSYALCLLVIFHLQTCVPAILPPFKDVCTGSTSIHTSMSSTEEFRFQHICATNIERFISLRTVNRSTLAQLMVSFFEKFSQLESMAPKHLICTYSGRWEERSQCRLMARRKNKLIIQDPLVLSDNAARTVGDYWYMHMISQAFSSTYNSLKCAAPSRTSYKACLLRE